MGHSFLLLNNQLKLGGQVRNLLFGAEDANALQGFEYHLGNPGIEVDKDTIRIAKGEVANHGKNAQLDKTRILISAADAEFTNIDNYAGVILNKDSKASKVVVHENAYMQQRNTSNVRNVVVEKGGKLSLCKNATSDKLALYGTLDIVEGSSAHLGNLKAPGDIVNELNQDSCHLRCGRIVDLSKNK